MINHFVHRRSLLRVLAQHLLKQVRQRLRYLSAVLVKVQLKILDGALDVDSLAGWVWELIETHQVNSDACREHVHLPPGVALSRRGPTLFPALWRVKLHRPPVFYQGVFLCKKLLRRAEIC